MKADRKRALTVAILEYMATHMEEVLNVEGPHDLVVDDEEDRFLVTMFHREADKLRDRAIRLESK